MPRACARRPHHVQPPSSRSTPPRFVPVRGQRLPGREVANFALNYRSPLFSLLRAVEEQLSSGQCNKNSDVLVIVFTAAPQEPKAKAVGVYKGRKPTISGAEIRKLKKDGLGATEIAKRLGIGRASVYRALG